MQAEALLIFLLATVMSHHLCMSFACYAVCLPRHVTPMSYAAFYAFERAACRDVVMPTPCHLLTPDARLTFCLRLYDAASLYGMLAARHRRCHAYFFTFFH